DHLQRLDLHLGLGQPLGEGALLDQAAGAVRSFFAGDAPDVFDAGIEVGRVGIATAFELEQVLGDRPAGILRADAVGDRRAHVVEEHLVDLMVTGQSDDRLHRQAGRVYRIDQHEGNAVLWLAFGRGAHEAEHVVGDVRAGRPDLGAVDHVVVALAHGARLEAGEVGARAGLGVALAEHDVARHDPGQVLGLLLGRAELHDHGPDHADAHGEDARRVDGNAFAGEDVALGGAPAGAAMFRGPGRRRPAALGQHLVPAQSGGDVGEHAAGLAPGLA